MEMLLWNEGNRAMSYDPYFKKHICQQCGHEEEFKNKIRGFEVCKGYENKAINLPKRSTTNSAGYDFECAEDRIIPALFNPKIDEYVTTGLLMTRFKAEFNTKPTLIPTGIKSFMQPDEALFLYNRSSNPIKKGLVLANGVGIVDADFYQNIDNDGNIQFAFYNFSHEDVLIKKNEKIGQGIFQKYLKADDDNAEGERVGGYGSTDNIQ